MIFSTIFGVQQSREIRNRYAIILGKASNGYPDNDYNFSNDGNYKDFFRTINTVGFNNTYLDFEFFDEWGQLPAQEWYSKIIKVVPRRRNVLVLFEWIVTAKWYLNMYTELRIAEDLGHLSQAAVDSGLCERRFVSLPATSEATTNQGGQMPGLGVSTISFGFGYYEFKDIRYIAIVEKRAVGDVQASTSGGYFAGQASYVWGDVNVWSLSTMLKIIQLS